MSKTGSMSSTWTKDFILAPHSDLRGFLQLQAPCRQRLPSGLMGKALPDYAGHELLKESWHVDYSWSGESGGRGSK